MTPPWSMRTTAVLTNETSVELTSIHITGSALTVLLFSHATVLHQPQSHLKPKCHFQIRMSPYQHRLG